MTAPTTPIGVLGFSAAVATLPTVGITDDDDFYQHAGHAYVRWGKLLTQPTQALRRTQIGNFSHNREHPPPPNTSAQAACSVTTIGWWSSPRASRLGICAMLARDHGHIRLDVFTCGATRRLVRRARLAALSALRVPWARAHLRHDRRCNDERFLTVLLAPAPKTGLAGARHHGAGLRLGAGE